MSYVSTVTSKGTITIPAPLRRKFALLEGDKVEISLQGSTITIRPKLGWEEFFAASEEFGAKARKQIATGKRKRLLTNNEIAEVVHEARMNQNA